MININNLTVSYNNHKVLNQFNADFEVGKVHGIIGLNGAGKSTFFNVMAGYHKGDDGVIQFNYQPLLKQHTGYLETHHYFYPGLTGNDYLNIFPQTNVGFNLDALQSLFQLPLQELITHYSTGMKKKLALLAMLKQDKPVYLLDEPFNGLDLESNKVLELIIQQLKQKGKTIFISSHILDPLLHTTDEIHWLADGKIKQKFLPNQFNQIDEKVFGLFKQQASDVVKSAV